MILAPGQRLRRGPVRLQRDLVVADTGNPLDQVLARRIVPAVNGMGVVGLGGTSSAALTVQSSVYGCCNFNK